MTYRVLYGDGLDALANDRRRAAVARAEKFRTESEALSRVRELFSEDEHHSVAICDGAGNVLHGLCLRLKLEHFTD